MYCVARHEFTYFGDNMAEEEKSEEVFKVDTSASDSEDQAIKVDTLFPLF